VFEDLIEAGWRVSKKTVAASMARQGLVGRCPNPKPGSRTRPDKAATPIPHLLKRNLSARAVDKLVRGPDRDLHRGEQAVPGDRA
jgi:hypothetical protein